MRGFITGIKLVFDVEGEITGSEFTVEVPRCMTEPCEIYAPGDMIEIKPRETTNPIKRMGIGDKQ